MWIQYEHVVAAGLCSLALAQADVDKKPQRIDPSAPPYVAFGSRRIFGVGEEGDGGREVRVDSHLLSILVDRLEANARNYPPRFRSEAERRLAELDVKTASDALAVVLEDRGRRIDGELLLLAARLEAVAHNVDLPGAARRAESYFERVLEQDPKSGAANLRYGMFLAGLPNGQQRAIPHLQRAADAGLVVAHRGLGVVHLMLGDKPRALEHLRSFLAKNPDDAATARLIESIERERAPADGGEKR